MVFVLLTACQKTDSPVIGEDITKNQKINQFQPFSSPPKIIPFKPQKVENSTIDSPDIIQAKTPKLLSVLKNDAFLKPPNMLIPNKDFNISYQNLDSTKRILSDKVNTEPTLISLGNPIPAKEFRFKDNSVGNLQFLDVEQGLPSSYIWVSFLDSRGNMWFGTEGGGVVSYDGSTYRIFTTEQGLSNNSVRVIFEDHDGQMWFGTHGGGLTRYDGSFFYQYNNENGLVGNYITSITEDENGVLWIGTLTGISKLKNSIFENFTVSNGLPGNAIRSLYYSSAHELWMGIEGVGFSIFNTKEFKTFELPQKEIPTIIYSFYENPDGSMWIGTEEDGILIYQNDELKQLTTSEGLLSNTIRHIIVVEDETWVATYGGGVNIIKGDQVRFLTEEVGLSNDYSRHLLLDKSNNIWISTDGGGISKYTNGAFENITSSYGLISDYVRTIVQVDDTTFWLGNYGGLLNIKPNEHRAYLKEHGLPGVNIISLLLDNSNTLWAGTFDYGLIKFSNNQFYSYKKVNGLSDNTVRVIVKDHLGRLWIGTNQGLPNNTIWDLYLDSSNQMWIGTDNGIAVYRGDSLQIFSKENGIGSNIIRTFEEDFQHQIWVGTYDNGITLFKKDSLQIINKSNGLSNNLVWTITEDDAKDMWVSTENGINRVNLDQKNNFQITKYGKSDGLKSMDFYSNSVLKDNQGTLWWGGGKSLIKLNPNELSRDYPSPTLSLVSVRINDDYVDFRQYKNTEYRTKHPKIDGLQINDVVPYFNYPEKIILPSSVNKVTFDFSATDWSTTEKPIFQYFLEGFDSDWSKETFENYVSYNLREGTYTLYARSKGKSNTWSNVFIYQFSKTPPWWRAWWFQVIAILSIGLLLFFYIRIRIYSIRERQKMLENIVAERTQDLNTKNKKLEEVNYEKDETMNIVAHDLKSPLNKINGLLQLTEIDGELNENQKEYVTMAKNVIYEGVDMIQNLLDAFSFDHRDEKVIYQLVDLKVFMKDWIKGFEQNMKLKDQYLQFSIQPEITTITTNQSLLKRILDNLMSNAIKFSEKNKTIHITVGLEADEIKFSVLDEGPGISENDQKLLFKKFQKLSARPTAGEKSSGLGLSIIKSLVKQLKGRITFKSTLGKGTEFCVYLPK